MTKRIANPRAQENGPYMDPLTWLVGGGLDLLYLAVDRLVGRRVEALIRRLPHR